MEALRALPCALSLEERPGKPCPWSRIAGSCVRDSTAYGCFQNSATPKSSILIGFSIINHPFWDTPIFGSTPILNVVVWCIFTATGCSGVKFCCFVWPDPGIRLHHCFPQQVGQWLFFGQTWRAGAKSGSTFFCSHEFLPVVFSRNIMHDRTGDVRRVCYPLFLHSVVPERFEEADSDGRSQRMTWHLANKCLRYIR